VKVARSGYAENVQLERVEDKIINKKVLNWISSQACSGKKLSLGVFIIKPLITYSDAFGTGRIE